jgi:hypothetical protein
MKKPRQGNKVHGKYFGSPFTGIAMFSYMDDPRLDTWKVHVSFDTPILMKDKSYRNEACLTVDYKTNKNEKNNHFIEVKKMTLVELIEIAGYQPVKFGMGGMGGRVGFYLEGDEPPLAVMKLVKEVMEEAPDQQQELFTVIKNLTLTASPSCYVMYSKSTPWEE